MLSKNRLDSSVLLTGLEGGHRCRFLSPGDGRKDRGPPLSVSLGEVSDLVAK